MTTNDFKSGYEREGYQHLKGFFDRAEIQAILDETKWVFVQQMKRAGISTAFDHTDESKFRTAMASLFENDFEAFLNCGKQVQHSFNLHRIALDARIEQLLRDLGLNQPNICTRPVLYFNHESLAKEKVYHTVFSHQDWRSMQGSVDSIVVWCPLIDIDRTLGALELAPRSHLRGLIADGVEAGFGRVDENVLGKSAFRAIEVKQGDLLLFSSFLVHRSGENTTDRIRWSCHFRYNNLADPTYVARKYHHNYIYRPNDELRTSGFPTQADIEGVFGSQPTESSDE